MILPDWAALEAWLLEHLEENLRVERLARQCGMSTRNFARACRGTPWRTPGDFLLGVRLREACRRLEAGETLQQAGSACGFDYEETFRRAFKRRLGMTPGAWRDLEVATRPKEAPMPAAVVSNAYAGSRHIACAEDITGTDTGKLLRVAVAEGVLLTVKPNSWKTNEWVELLNIGTVPFVLDFGEGKVNRADQKLFEVPPDQHTRLVLVSDQAPRWCAWMQPALPLEANQGLAADAEGVLAEARTDRYAIGLDLVLDGDEKNAGYWRAPWPGVIESVAAITRGGTASIELRHGPNFGQVAGFGRPVAVNDPSSPETVICCGEPFAAGDWFHCSCWQSEGLVPDKDNVRGILVSFTILRTGG